MYKVRFPPLLQFLDDMDKCEDYIYVNHDKLLKMIEESELIFQEEDFFSPNIALSPKINKKVSKYKIFMKVLTYLYEVDHYISKTQYNCFHYLYIDEDINIFAAFEVYMATMDLNDFVENLIKIQQINYFKRNKKQNGASKFEQLSEETLKQFYIIFTFQKYLSANERKILKKTVRNGDTALLNLYQQFKQDGNIQSFSKKLKQFSLQRE